jgi:hypothetical protein
MMEDAAEQRQEGGEGREVLERLSCIRNREMPVLYPREAAPAEAKILRAAARREEAAAAAGIAASLPTTPSPLVSSSPLRAP